MKKTISILLAALLLFSTACSTSDGTSPSSKLSATTSALGHASASDNETGPNVSSNGTSSPSADVQIGLIECEHSYEIDVPEQAAYYNDYIFAATVVKVLGPYDPYAEPEYVAEYGEVPVYDPCFTKYQLQVTQVIKGSLQVGDTINARKMGYYDQDDEMYYMAEQDVMPEEGREYLFLSNNRMRDNVHGINHAIPLEPGGTEVSTYALTDEEPDRESIMARYTEAYENEVPYEPPTADTHALPGGVDPDDVGYSFDSSYDDPTPSTYE